MSAVTQLCAFGGNREEWRLLFGRSTHSALAWELEVVAVGDVGALFFSLGESGLLTK